MNGDPPETGSRLSVWETLPYTGKLLHCILITHIAWCLQRNQTVQDFLVLTGSKQTSNHASWMSIVAHASSSPTHKFLMLSKIMAIPSCGSELLNYGLCSGLSSSQISNQLPRTQVSKAKGAKNLSIHFLRTRFKISVLFSVTFFSLKIYITNLCMNKA